MTDLDAIRRSLAACTDIPWACACVDREQLAALVAEMEHLRGERAAVVAWLRRGADEMACYAGCIERGEHRREEGA